MLYGKNNGETMKTPMSGVLKENFHNLRHTKQYH
jgi:hypothetical protein